jgi:hypothetical protein
MRPKILGVLAVLALILVTQSFTLNAQEAKKSSKKKGHMAGPGASMSVRR